MATKTTTQTEVDTTAENTEATEEVVHSDMFNDLNFKYQMGYVTVSNLRQRVKLAKRVPSLGITEAEFEEITGMPYSS